MRNLNLWHVYEVKSENDLGDMYVACVGQNEDLKSEIYVCTSNQVVFNLKNDGWSSNLGEIIPHNSKPIDITYSSLNNALYVAYSSGELIKLQELDANYEKIGVCQDGFLALEWSPDQEILVYVTKDFVLSVASHALHTLCMINLISEDVGEMQLITVGWGKKETQFQGSKGKKGATASINELTGSDYVVNDNVKITWRGDGNYFAVGYNEGGIRRFKVFDRDGNLQSSNEIVPGLEANLSWRPSGDLIATTQKFGGKYLVSFFEKNGLKHGDIVLPVRTAVIVEDLLWSPDSELLIVVCLDVKDNRQQIYLYTRCNYHWYLKQFLYFQNDQKINKVICKNDFKIPEYEKRIFVFLHTGQLYIYSWDWNVDHSQGKSSEDNAIVAVIDGNKALISDFRHSVVPPPMCNFELVFEHNIHSIRFISNISSEIEDNSFFVYYGHNIAIAQCTQKNPLQYKIMEVIKLDDELPYLFPLQYYNWHWLSNKNILCVSLDNNNCKKIIDFSMVNDKIFKINEISLKEAITNIQNHPTDNTIAILQTENGNILEYKCGATNVPEFLFSSVLYRKFSVANIDADITVIGLSYNGCLYSNSKKIISDVNSFFVHTQFLLITTLKHQLVCVELTKCGIDDLEYYAKDETYNRCYQRKIERGSRLVIAAPNGTRTVFQMPRGNLETIQPRPLTLKIIGKYLDSLKYQEAYDLMRKERINLNLICDHNVDLFMNNIEVFVKSISNDSWLNIFISDLENVDVTTTMYSSSYSNQPNYWKEQSKIDSISKEIERILWKTHNGFSARILPLLTICVKRNSVMDMEKALEIIQPLKLHSGTTANHMVTFDEALKYLLYLVDVDKLFDVALGMYDFDLVLSIANKSQKDPKEYIPMLNELNEMDDNYKKFNINKHLKRFDKAVGFLAACGPSRYEEFRTFVKYHSLYNVAISLNLVTSQPELYKEIMDDYGHYLKLKKQFLEAGLVFEKCENYEQAIECYKECLQWEFVFKLAKYKKGNGIKNVLREIVIKLKDEKRCTEALQVLEQFENKENIIKFSIKSGNYKTALKLCYESDKKSLINDCLLPKVSEECSDIKTLLRSNQMYFTKYESRLMVVREEKRNKCDDHSYDNEDAELYSDAGSTLGSSIGSGSGRSHRSSKNRRKHQRKLTSLKEGSPFEDTALVITLHNCITSTFDLRERVREVNIVLYACDKIEEAVTLQNYFDEVLTLMKKSFKNIWSNSFLLEVANALIEAENSPDGVMPEGVACLASHMRIAPIIKDVKWRLEDVLDDVEGLAAPKFMGCIKSQ